MVPRIAVLDSGVSTIHKWDGVIEEGVSIFIDDNNKLKCANGDCEDILGHGTAVIDSIFHFYSNAIIIPIKIFHDSLEVSTEVLLYALEFIAENISCDIVHISAGVTYLENYPRLMEILDILTEKGVIVIAAFDNNGAISYPAACPQVIGVDSCHMNKKDDFYITGDNNVDIVVDNSYQRLKWVMPNHVIIQGNSFSVCSVTGIVSQLLHITDKKLSKDQIIFMLSHSPHSLKNSTAKKLHKTNYMRGVSFVNKIKKAVVFPFNKEIHPLAIHKNELPYRIMGFYDIRESSNCGKQLNEVLPFAKTLVDEDMQINQFENLDWQSDFDTIICGHCGEISSALNRDVLSEIVNKAIAYGKCLYAFDSLSNYIIPSDRYDDFFYPSIDTNDLPPYRMGRLRNRTTPIVGVFGTSSRQGKFTLQLELKNRLVSRGYNTAHISTEPNGYLLGCSGVFPMGYQSTVQIKGDETVRVLNEMIWDSTLYDTKDILIVGGQSTTITYDFSNLSQYAFGQFDFLSGTTPDICLLCVNAHDDIDYIKRSIAYLNSFGACVIGLVLCPIVINSIKLGYGITRTVLTANEGCKHKARLSKEFNLPVYFLDSESDMSDITDSIISELS